MTHEMLRRNVIKKIAVVFGTRPEAIKLAPVVLALRVQKDVECKVCVTGQHRQMLDQVLEVFGIVPDTDLQLMLPNQTLGGLTARAIEALDKYLSHERPSLVLGQGDTTTVFCAALASFYQHIPFGHVEAGLRTGDMKAPWPEEANRVLTTRLSSIHFAPTELSRTNLLNEGIRPETIHVTGNSVIDALLIAREKVRLNTPDIPGLRKDVMSGSRRLVLVTGHRRENFGTGFHSICTAIAELATQFSDVEFVYPVHLNPNVREPVSRILGAANLSNVHLIEPLSYLPFVALMTRATIILTDSGGVQEEAPSLGKPVLVMRETTERPEAVTAGTVRLVGTDSTKIVSGIAELLNNLELYNRMSNAHNPYGDGKATMRIIDICQKFLSCEP